jgi:hypothetical protein
MSYILDALKKIEHEKNKKARPDGRISISGDLFQEQKRPSARFGIGKIVLLIAVASLLTFTGTWVLLHGNGNKKSVDLSQSAVPPIATVQPQPVVPVPVQPQVAATTLAVPPSPPSAAGSVASKRAVAVTDDDSSVRSVRSVRKEIKVQPPLPMQHVQTVQPPADIKLSGIAWQDSRAARRAVVNGFLLKEGAVVSGAKITDIQADRVRFLSPAGSFEIRLDAVLPAEVKK